MWRKLPKNRLVSLGFVLLTMGSIAAVVGVLATVNRSERCLVLPGPFPPCVAEYQIPLLAPLYPISAGLVAFGVLTTILGSVLAFVGYSRRTGKEPSINS